MDNKNKDITYFISFCIEQYMHTKGMSEAEVMATFNKYKYCCPVNFETAHFMYPHPR